MVRMASERGERRYHGFALGGSRYRSLGKGGVSGGVSQLVAICNHTTSLDAAKSYTLYLYGVQDQIISKIIEFCACRIGCDALSQQKGGSSQNVDCPGHMDDILPVA